MVLSDRDIRAEIDAGRIVIDPFVPEAVQPSSVDLHLDNRFRVFRNSRYAVHRRARQEQPELTELVEIVGDEPFILHPGEFVLGLHLRARRTPERPRRAARGQELARAAGAADPLDRRLRRPRLGGQPDPGAVERRQPADPLYDGMKIGQVSFQRLSSPVEIGIRRRAHRVEVPRTDAIRRRAVPRDFERGRVVRR